MAGRGFRFCGCVIGIVATLGAGTGTARAEPLDLAAADDVTIDLTTEDDPVLNLRVSATGDGAIDAPVTVSLTAGAPLGAACDFVASEGFPEPKATRTVTFTISDADGCQLTDLDADEVTLTSSQIDDLGISATLKRDPSFPLSSYAGDIGIAAGVAAAVVAVSTVAAWVRWRKIGGFWLHPLDTATLTWSFNESWLSNLTALGALLATLLATTDVLDAIGPAEPDRAVFLFVNFGGLALSAAALVAYLMLRRYKVVERQSAHIPIRLIVTTVTKAGRRQLEVNVPTVDHSGKGSLDRTASTPKQWISNLHHVAVLEVPAKPLANGAAPKSCVALEVPSTTSHDDVAGFIYDTTVPQQKETCDGEREYEAVTKDTTTYRAQGCMLGFVVAGLLASSGVAIQLASIHAIVTKAELASGADTPARSILWGIAVLAAGYVFTTVFNRLKEVDSEPAESTPATSRLPRELMDECDLAPDPVAPALVLSRTEVGAEGIPVPLRVAVPAPAMASAYPLVGTSLGDEELRRPSVSTAF